jgi:predicted  nucleic acid-binding Zn-ribbon protein
MSESSNREVAADGATSSEEAINQMFAEMTRANKKMTRDQEEIERLKTETSEILARLKVA